MLYLLTVMGLAAGAAFVGSGGDDEIIGTDASDTVDAGDGDDVLIETPDDDREEYYKDYLRGGAGNDVLSAGDGTFADTRNTEFDTLYGGAGDDDFFLKSGAEAHGGIGADDFHISVGVGGDALAPIVKDFSVLDDRLVIIPATEGDYFFGDLEFSYNSDLGATEVWFGRVGLLDMLVVLEGVALDDISEELFVFKGTPGTDLFTTT